jgi:hypothetical protein
MRLIAEGSMGAADGTEENSTENRAVVKIRWSIIFTKPRVDGKGRWEE